MKKLLSGNEAIAYGAYHAGIRVAAAYPGTPSTEILENLARYKDIHAQWSTNEKVAFEVALGACYAGVRTLVSMKHVGLNVAADPFMAASVTGVRGGLVVVSADDPGIHSSQGEQDNRYYAIFAKVPMLEPSDSQEAYDMMPLAFEISERFDTPVMLRSTTRVSHAKTVVDINRERPSKLPEAVFRREMSKFVALPVNARRRQLLALQRMEKLAEYAESCSLNYIIRGSQELGIIASGIAFNYAREIFPEASFLKLGMSYPLPKKLIGCFAQEVKRLIVVEELEPFLEEQIKAMGLTVEGKSFVPRSGELSSGLLRTVAQKNGLLPLTENKPLALLADDLQNLPKRPPLLCPGCPHTGLFFILSSYGLRKGGADGSELGPVITGDIGCYTLAAYPCLSAMDTCACMGAGIGEALGMEKAGLKNKLVAVIGDSTFLHSGITSLLNAVYNKSSITVVVLDNRTTAMTGHQQHPGTGFTAQGEPAMAVDIVALAKSCGVANASEVSAFDIRALRMAVKEAINNPELVVLVVRGDCAAIARKKIEPMFVEQEKCVNCGVCLSLGCAALQKGNQKTQINAQLCNGCTLCQQLCSPQAIKPLHAQEGLNA
ncbi:MAG: indolepyruvate ferredoxin oxidoreductase subunit alpha [Dehalococcoidia bacterium]|nr:indolepyruvate ferredoxin oxidoreductase subunit alpha [Dehalococcoidia bacterium]